MLGAGSITVHHAQAWRAIPEVRIVAVANRTRSRGERRAAELGLDGSHVYEDYRALLRDEELDFVDIASAPHLHREHVLAAAERGLHVLCQKPFATSVDEAREMIAACETAGVRCVVNENWRWRRWYRDVKQMLDRGVVGRPRYARFYHHGNGVLPNPDGDVPTLLSRQPYTAEMPQLILYEWGIHLVDVLRFLFGDVERVYARMSRVSPLVEGEDMAVVMLVFRDGPTGILDISWGSLVADGERLERGRLDPLVVEGDAGSIELDPYQDDLILITTSRGTERRPARVGLTPAEAYQESFLNTHRHFVDCLRSGEPAENEARDNLKTFAATMAAYASSKQGDVVAVDAGTDGAVG
jgi:predicted dehydrogenase